MAGPDLPVVALIGLAALLAAANGANDAGKPVATLAGSGATSYRRALWWGAITTLAGAAVSTMLARGLARTFATGFLATGTGGGAAREAAAAALAATAWVLLATWLRGPVSTTHAIAGGLIGAGIASGGPGMVKWAALGPNVFVPLAASPLVAAVAAALLFPLVRASVGRWRGTCVCIGIREGRLAAAVAFDGSRAALAPPPLAQVGGPVVAIGSDEADCAPSRSVALWARPDHLHWLSAGATSLARGMNDAPKIAALALPALMAGGAAGAAGAGSIGEGRGAIAFVVVALAMAAGSILGGARIARVLGEKIVRLEGEEGLAANLATAALVLGASPLGLPVSTTHVATGAIAGAGGRGAVSWPVLRGIVLAWVVTLPAAALLGAGFTLALSRLF